MRGLTLFLLQLLPLLAHARFLAPVGELEGGLTVVDPAPVKKCATGTDNWGNCLEADRKRTTIRASASDTDDVSAEFLAGLKSANGGGLLVLEAGKTYVLGKKLDLTFLRDVYVRVDGEIKFTDDIPYWQANHFYYDFQKSITFWVWGGSDIKIFGRGTINGNGQAWYDGFAGREILDKENTYLRPILFMTDNATNIEISGLRFLNSPCWSTFLVRTKNVAFDRCRFDSHSSNENRPKNTDGFDSWNVDGLRVTNTEVDVGDDCFSPKPNTTNIHVENLWCNNTHGVSMGSIGQYPGTLDYISNAYIKNVTLLNGQTGARLKAWAGKDVGYGYIRNVTYEDIHVVNTDYPLVLDQCYFSVKPAECAKYPSRVNISDVRFINITGTSSGKRKNKIAELLCSPGATCSGIELRNINITSPNAKGKEVIVCDNVKGGVGLPCVSSAEAVTLQSGKGKGN
ncbi:glycoside hydrolase family 28 protein [Trichodelitschia bisporula]|uniref:galacturonan 1,4-alpha-galacturonidase n=1 Tax=Trichodelitschia bisporula TaxID=703511 RepID=A0A6G1HNE4_9PEZI|nr:glycoside hydrolase family 28 protein [Trichodelitschia bisporula]